MKKFINPLIVGAVIAVVTAGCASAPSRFYTLNSTTTADGSTTANYAIAVGPVTVPAAVDRPQITIQVAPNRVAVDEFNRWAEPLSQNIARVVAANLATMLGTLRVASSPLANFNPDYRVAINIQQFESVPGKSVTVEALWVVLKPAGSVSLSGHTVASEPVSGNDYDALAAAHSRALTKVSSDIAAAIRSEAGEKP